jgi:Carbohydrate binding module (family 6)
MKKHKNSLKIVFLTVAGLAGNTSANASAIGQLINATSFSSETHPADANIIRKLGTKVGYIKSHPTDPTYMGFNDYNVVGATHVTVRASSGAATGGILDLTFGRPAGTSAALVNITPTGGWNTFQDFTVPLDPQETARSNGLPIYAVIDPAQTTYEYDLQSLKFERSSVGTAIEAESLSREQLPSVLTDVRIVGTKVGNIKQGSNWIEYDNINFVGSASSVTFTAASGNLRGGDVIIYDGLPAAGVELGRVKINYTGGWNVFETFSANIPFIAGGIKKISLKFEAGDLSSNYLMDIDKFAFNLNPITYLNTWVNAATFDEESAASDQDIIRDQGTKVGHIKNDLVISDYEYFIFNNFDITGARSVTIRYSSGGTGGTLDVCSQSFYSNQFAIFDLPPTGGWNIVKEVTLPIDQNVLRTHGSGLRARPLVFSIYEEGNNTDYKYDIHAFRFNP